MTTVYSMGRRAGKSMLLLMWLRETPGSILVTFSAAEADRLRHELLNLEQLVESDWHRPPVDPHRIVSITEALNGGLLGRHHGRIAVDNAELVLGVILGQTPAVMSVTKS